MYYVHADHLRGTSVLTGATGNIPGTVRYHCYGQTRAQTGTMPTDQLFTGQTMDSGTGLYFYGARYYDAVLGRFLAPDRAGPDLKNPQSLNKYAYALNNPVRYTDPTGNEPEDEEGGGEGGGGEGGDGGGGDGAAEAGGEGGYGPVELTAGDDAAAHGAPEAVSAFMQTVADSIVGFSTNALHPSSGEDPVNWGVGMALTALSGDATSRTGDLGERIHENVGGVTGWVMENVLQTEAFTTGEDVFARGEMNRLTQSHEEGHVQEARALRPAYLPADAIGAMFAVEADVLYGGGLHFWNPMEQAAQRIVNGAWFPWGTN